MLKKVALLALPLSLAVFAEVKTVTVKGSDTMVILAQRWAEVYMKAHPDVNIQVTGGGSGAGAAALINGTTEIANMSRPLKDAERAQLKQKYGSPGVEIKVAQDGISLYLNPKNQVDSLTLAQLKDIYQAKITNWKEVGGADKPIILYGRENNSGTYDYFKEHVLEKQDFAATMQHLPGTAGVVNAVTKDVNGIGFGGAAYGKGIKFAKVKKDAASPAIEPNKETIISNTYPISRALFMYTRKQPEGAAKQWVDWILSKDGQALIEEVGYFPLK